MSQTKETSNKQPGHINTRKELCGKKNIFMVNSSAVLSGKMTNVPSKWVNKLHRVCLENTELLLANQKKRLQTTFMIMTHIHT